MTKHKVAKVATKPFQGQKPGTSGLRKRVAEFSQPGYLDNFTECTLRVAFRDAKSIVLGGDGRYWCKEAIGIILSMCAAHGIEKVLVGKDGILSTPAVSALIRAEKVAGGIVLTASHNPGGPDADFGMKCNMQNGGPANEAITDAIFAESTKIEQYCTLSPLLDIDLSQVGVQQREIESQDGSATRTFTVQIVDSVEGYLHLMREIFDFDLIKNFLKSGKNGQPFKVVWDCLSGVTGPYAKRILIEELGADAGSVDHGVPLPDFGGHHPDPNLTYAHELVEKVCHDKSIDFAAAFDGDGDRNMILGAGGFFVTPSDSLAVIGDHLEAIPYFKRAGVRGFARSMPTGMAIDRVAKQRGLSCYEVPTGWKFFGNLMDADRIAICGEESFGTGSTHIREKDGIWAALAWLNVLAANGQAHPGSTPSVEALVKAFWKKFGRNAFQRLDFENCDSAKANTMMSRLEAELAKSSLVGSHLEAEGEKFTVAHADNFEYVDPVDGSVTRKQGLRLLFSDGSRIVWRLSGTGSSGATIRVYVERYVEANVNEEHLFASASTILRALISLSLNFSQLREITGRTEPDVVT